MPTVIMMARAPAPGRCKTRLQPLLGAAGAARLQAWLIRDRLALAEASRLHMVLHITPDPRHPAFLRARRQGHALLRQRSGDLGRRMFEAARRQHGAVLIIGTDCPALGPAQLQAATQALEEHPLVLIPATDGGYVLIGLRQVEARLFSGISWGSQLVAAQTRRQARRVGLKPHVLPVLPDLDEPRDYRRARRQAWLPAWGKRL